MNEVDHDNVILSIIVPAYNCEQYIERCILSLINAVSLFYTEIIIVNDGSTDGTYELLLKFEEKYDFVRVLDQKNQGVSVARNNAFFLANGRYITFIDADDYVESNKYREICEIIAKSNDDIICFGMMELSNEKLANINFVNKDKYKDFVEYPKYMNSVCNKFFKRTFLEENRIVFNDKLATCEDLLFTLEAFICTVNIAYLNVSAYIYARNRTSVTKTPNNLKKSRDEYLVSCIINNLSIGKNIPEIQQISKYWRLVSAMRNLKDIDAYDVDEYRSKNQQKLLWIYTFKPTYWILSLFANFKFDIVPMIYIQYKKYKYTLKTLLCQKFLS